MTVSFRASARDDLPALEGSVVIFVPGDGKLSGAAAAMDAALGGALARSIDSSRFHAKHGEALEFPAPAGMAAKRVIAAGLGLEALTIKTARELGGKVAVALGRLDDKGATVLGEDIEDVSHLADIALGLRLRRYAFTRYKTSVDPKRDLGPGGASFSARDPGAAGAAYESAEALAQGVFLTRDLVSEPANELYPESFAERLEALSEHGLEVEVLEDAKLEELGMGALLAVGKGSARGSRVVIMKWMGAADKSAKPFAAVGKGVTFDTGGISLKPSAGMEEMTMDMGGAGVVAGLMKCVAMRKAKANVIGVVGLVENMPDGMATRPGDVITAMSGKTIEVINTDAEGRLVLADILHYTQKTFSPAATVNLATLTGAMIIALGHTNAGFFSNNDDLAADMLKSAQAEGEGLWRLPLGKEYDELIKSHIADIKNTGGRAAGSITAAQFLQRFVDDSPWAHIDIAGVTLAKEAKPLCPKGASGWGVATLDRLVRDRFES